jgi:hypothetical protein
MKPVGYQVILKLKGSEGKLSQRQIITAFADNRTKKSQKLKDSVVNIAGLSGAA